MYNGVAAIGLGAYILAVVIGGNATRLFDLLKDEGGYVKWLIAFLILLAIAENENTKEIGRPLIVVAFVALAINASKDQTLWSGVQTLINLLNPDTVRN